MATKPKTVHHWKHGWIPLDAFARDVLAKREAAKAGRPHPTNGPPTAAQLRAGSPTAAQVRAGSPTAAQVRAGSPTAAQVRAGSTPRHGMGDHVRPEDPGPGASSMRNHLVTGPDGSLHFTPERQALHDAIIAKHLDGHKPSGDKTYNVMGGGPAAGKSTMVKSGQVDHLTKPAVMVNADEMKDELPEYRAMNLAKDTSSAGFAHEESSYLAKRLQAAAFERNLDVNLDGTGDSSHDAMMKKLAAARKHGYKVNGFYTTVPTEVAVTRAHTRGLKTGRHVNPDVIRNTHRAVSQIVPSIASQFDHFQLYDTTNGVDLVYSQTNGQAPEIHDLTKWNQFLAKGGE